MEWYEALILGIIQGLTEFLPISSSGHLEIASFILKTEQSQNLVFTVLVHIATAISIIYVFRDDIFKIIKGVFLYVRTLSSQYSTNAQGLNTKREERRRVSSVQSSFVVGSLTTRLSSKRREETAVAIKDSAMVPSSGLKMDCVRLRIGAKP